MFAVIGKIVFALLLTFWLCAAAAGYGIMAESEPTNPTGILWMLVLGAVNVTAIVLKPKKKKAVFVDEWAFMAERQIRMQSRV